MDAMSGIAKTALALLSLALAIGCVAWTAPPRCVLDKSRVREVIQQDLARRGLPADNVSPERCPNCCGFFYSHAVGDRRLEYYIFDDRFRDIEFHVADLDEAGSRSWE